MTIPSAVARFLPDIRRRHRGDGTIFLERLGEDDWLVTVRRGDGQLACAWCATPLDEASPRRETAFDATDDPTAPAVIVKSCRGCASASGLRRAAGA